MQAVVPAFHIQWYLVIINMCFKLSLLDPLPNLDGIELGDANGAAGSDDEYTWNNVLVDEIDFVHAVERGRINRNDLHIMGCRSSG